MAASNFLNFHKETDGSAEYRGLRRIGSVLLDREGSDISTANAFPITEVSSKNMEGGGKISVGTTAVEVTFTGTPTKSIIITADISNSGTLYVGESNVTNTGANALTFLLAGESLTIDYDDSDNAVYVVASASSQNFWKGTLL